MDNGRCKTCKHFTPDPKQGPYGSCERWQAGYYHYAKISDLLPLNEVRVENDEGWGAIMGPEFGCVLWETASGG